MQFWCAPWKGLQGHPITAILRNNEKFHFKTIFKKGSRWLTDLSKISITTSIARAKGDLSMIFELTALVDEILLPDMIKSIQNKIAVRYIGVIVSDFHFSWWTEQLSTSFVFFSNLIQKLP